MAKNLSFLSDDARVRELQQAVTQALLVEHRISPFAIPIDNAPLHSLAVSHRVSSLLLQSQLNLYKSGSDSTILRTEAKKETISGLRLAAESERVATLFDEIGIDYLLFKGITLSLLTHRTIASRGSGDVDILVRKGDVPFADKALVRAGYSRLAAYEPRGGLWWRCMSFRERELSYRRGQTTVDLHWRISKNALLTPKSSDLLARKTTVSLLGRAVPTLSPEDAFHVACVTAYQDYFQNLRQLVDISYLVIQHANSENLAARARSSLLVRDILEASRRILHPDLFPQLEEKPSYSGKGVSYLLKMWQLNSTRSALEAGPPDWTGEAVSRLFHQIRYAPRASEIARFAIWALFSVPLASQYKGSIGPLGAFSWRIRQLVTGKFPYQLARRDSRDEHP